MYLKNLKTKNLPGAIFLHSSACLWSTNLTVNSVCDFICSSLHFCQIITVYFSFFKFSIRSWEVIFQNPV